MLREGGWSKEMLVALPSGLGLTATIQVSIHSPCCESFAFFLTQDFLLSNLPLQASPDYGPIFAFEVS